MNVILIRMNVILTRNAGTTFRDPFPLGRKLGQIADTACFWRFANKLHSKYILFVVLLK